MANLTDKISNSGVATALQGTKADNALPQTGGDMSGGLGVVDVTETVGVITGITPSIVATDGTIQTWTLSGDSSPTFGFLAGQSITLMIDDGSGRSITWPTMQWIGGTPPPLATSGYTVVIVWRVGAGYYGAGVGQLS
jgi:hypothetical protein